MIKIAPFILLAVSVTAKAQNTETYGGRLDFFSAVGMSQIDKTFKPASGKSIQTTTGLELKLSRYSGIGAALSFDSYTYKRSGASYNLNGTLKATAFAIFYRYKFGNHTWQPYLKAGGGTAWLSIPLATTKQAVTNVENKVQNVAFALAEVGVQLRVLPRYALLFAAERKWMAEASVLDQTSLRAAGFKVGVISSF